MTYRLAWASDWHLEFLPPEKLTLFLHTLRELKADGLVVCGDIGTTPRLRQYLAALSSIGKPVYFVCGNHDFYLGDLKETSAQIEATCREHLALRWLSLGDIIPLTPPVALVGHDGWADGRAGLGMSTPVGMNDSVLIKDFRSLSKEQLFVKLRDLGEASARCAEDVITKAARRFDHIIFATLAPPFIQAARYQGAPCSLEFLPFYVNVSLGETLLSLARSMPKKRFDLLCGHTHEAFECKVAPNLKVRVAGVSYGHPKVEAIFHF